MARQCTRSAVTGRASPKSGSPQLDGTRRAEEGGSLCHALSPGPQPVFTDQYHRRTTAESGMCHRDPFPRTYVHRNPVGRPRPK